MGHALGVNTDRQETTMQTLTALNRLNDMATSFVVSQAFTTACHLGLFDYLATTPATAEEIARHLTIHPDGCRRLLVMLTQLGLLHRDHEHFSNADLGSFLTSTSPVPLASLDMWGTLFYRMWEFLPEALREYSPRWHQAIGTTAQETFAAIYEDPVRLRRFCSTMDAYSIPIGQEIATRYDFTPHHCLLDVAGGSGALSQQIGRRYPHLRGIVMDLPPVCTVANEAIAANGLSERFTTAPADLFLGPYPGGADVITLSWILHDWSAEHCQQILYNCYTALPSGGVLLISESVLRDDGSGTPFAVAMALHMLVACEPGATERTEAQYQSLLEDAGFRAVEVVRLAGPRDLIIARKP